VPYSGEPPARRSGSNATAIAIIVAALVLTVGGVGAALIVTGAFKSDPGPTGHGKTTPHRARVSGGPLSSYPTATYSASVPAGWTKVRDYELQTDGRRYVTEFQKGDRDILIDTTPNPVSTDLRADESYALKSDGKPGYQRIQLTETQVGDKSSVVWVFDQGGVRKTDIFFFDGGRGYAVLATGPPSTYAANRALAERVAASLHSN
jgi:hypothetical protein